MTSEAPDGILYVDFAGLAAADSDFAEVYGRSDGHLDFQDARTVQQLTKSILKTHFNLKIELPDDRLCPPVPVRYEYIKWLESLVDTTNPDFLHADKHNECEIVGIDIGVGASCIYPLLGCASHPAWRFHGTEVDSKSIEYARNNVSLNGLSCRISLHKIDDADEPLLPLDSLDIPRADFTMCNPPFYTSQTDMQATHLNKKRPPSAVCSGAEVEMITEGGDFGFVMRILEESRRLQDRVQWYSSMLGKLSSATQLVEKLKEYGISNYAVTNLQAGNVTKRWAVAWSFGDMRPTKDVARRNVLIKQLLPLTTEVKTPFLVEHRPRVSKLIDNLLSSMDLQWNWDVGTQSGICIAADNVWSRSARRKRQKLAADDLDSTPHIKIKQKVEQGLCVKILIEQDSVNVRWLKGRDAMLYESFCGMIRRCISNTPMDEVCPKNLQSA